MQTAKCKIAECPLCRYDCLNFDSRPLIFDLRFLISSAAIPINPQIQDKAIGFRITCPLSRPAETRRKPVPPLSRKSKIKMAESARRGDRGGRIMIRPHAIFAFFVLHSPPSIPQKALKNREMSPFRISDCRFVSPRQSPIRNPKSEIGCRAGAIALSCPARWVCLSQHGHGGTAFNNMGNEKKCVFANAGRTEKTAGRD